MTQTIQLDLLNNNANQTLSDAIDITLRNVREALHRHARLSTRNDAIDEVCKLLFAHIVTTVEEGVGIHSSILLTDGKPAAEALSVFVRNAFDKHLPASLTHEMTPSDFYLKLKPQENTLGEEIIKCFEFLDLSEWKAAFTGLNAVDVVNEVFGKFLTGSFAEEKELGQYLTPPEIVTLMVDMVLNDLTQEEAKMLFSPHRCVEFGFVLDPSCGTGSFLSEFVRTVYYTVADHSGVSEANIWLRNFVNHCLIGVDKSERMIRLALTNMAMFGLPAAMLHLSNALIRTGEKATILNQLENRTRIILTNPPFGAEFSGDDIAAYKIGSVWADRKPSKVDSELLFMERYTDWLVGGGRAIVVVPDSILTNKGLFQVLRAGLSEVIDVRAIVSLPPVTFGAAGTTTKTSVVYLQKKPNSIKRTYLATCNDVGFTIDTRGTQKNRVSTGKGELPEIFREFTQATTPTIGRWVDEVANQERWDATYHTSLSATTLLRLNNPRSDDVLLSDVASLAIERTNPAKFNTPTFRYIEISDVDGASLTVYYKDTPCSDAPSRARKIVRQGDILLSTVRPERKTIGVVGAELDGAVCTTGFAVIRPEKIDSYSLALLLQSGFVTEQLLRNNTGISYPVIEEQCLSTLLLPVPAQDLPKLAEVAEGYQRLLAQQQQARLQLESRVEEATRNWLSPEENLSPKLQR
jgi:type I restriction-modification system DNA methylase subunit